MIAKGSMVALKGHAQFPMVVVHVGVNVPAAQYRRGMDDNFAAVAWLDRHGVPHDETYSLELLEELDG
jgi:hypothetical protein